jgi:UDP-perosamine 4-acetyltransferase
MKLVLIGARHDGQAHVVLDLLRETGAHDVVAFLDETPSLRGTTVHGIPVLGPPDAIEQAVAIGVDGGMVSIGDARARERLGAVIVDAGLELVTLIHPRAYIAPSATIGRGVFISALAYVGTGAVIEDSAYVGFTAVVSHHVHVGACASLSGRSTSGGRSRVGRRAFLGLGAIILPDLTVGDDAVVGAGAVVTKDVPPGYTVVGVPARAKS